MKKASANAEREAERRLIMRARNGESTALRELVDAHKERLFAFIWRMVRHHHDAEEICQDAFLKAFVSLDSFSSEYRFSTWLFTIGYRVCLNHLRRKRPFTGDLDASILVGAEADVRESALESEEAGRLKNLVWSAVDQLSPPQRATLLMFYRHEFNCREIARVLELPVATVKSHLHRGRNRLRELLETVSDAELQEFRNRAGSAG